MDTGDALWLPRNPSHSHHHHVTSISSTSLDEPRYPKRLSSDGQKKHRSISPYQYRPLGNADPYRFSQKATQSQLRRAPSCCVAARRAGLHRSIAASLSQLVLRKDLLLLYAIAPSCWVLEYFNDAYTLRYTHVRTVYVLGPIITHTYMHVILRFATTLVDKG